MFFIIFITIILSSLIYFGLSNPKRLIIVCKTFPRDCRLAVRFIRLKLKVSWMLWTQASVGSAFEGLVQKHPEKPCFYFGDQVWTYIQVEKFSNQVATYFYDQGYRKGDRICLFMENRVEYICIWLGLSKIGVITALINYNLTHQPLCHSIEAAQSKAIIYGSEQSQAIAETSDETCFQKLKHFCFGAEGKAIPQYTVDLETALKTAGTNSPRITDTVTANDVVLLVYTSGTTGLPKAAIIKHSRVLLYAYGVRVMNGVKDSDTLYTPLPLYHVQGGVVGVGQALFSGIPVVLVKKFSASRFWKDCIRYNVTVSQYLGEICRFLLSQPPAPEGKLHKVRLMFGNGIRPEIWPQFLERFNNPIMAEVYGATEGNCQLANIDGHVGTIGFMPVLLITFPLIPQALILIDEKTGDPIRDPKTGFVVRAKAYEPGEMIGKIVPSDPVREFQGYTDKVSSQQKILQNAFRKGDSYFRTGDILSYDDHGYFYFRDRRGDTYRWKGENVSTLEVEGVLNRLTGFKDVAVYGVEIPNSDGKAGMAAIVDAEGSLNLETLGKAIQSELPSYARPVFIRILPFISTTGTFKLQKMDLQRDGFDVHKINSGSIYVFLEGIYVQLDLDLYFRVITGKIRL